MEDKKKEYHKMDENELHKEAENIRKLENLEQAVEEGHKLVTGMFDSKKFGLKYHKASLDIDAGKLNDLSKSVHEQFEEKASEGKNLSYEQQMNTFDKLANLIGPKMYLGSDAKEGSDSWKQNAETLKFYLSNMKDEKGQPKDVFAQVQGYIERGDVESAKFLIVSNLKNHYTQRDLDNVMTALIPLDDKDYHLGLGKLLAKKHSKEIQEAGIMKEVTPSSVADKIHETYSARAHSALEKKKAYKTIKAADSADYNINQSNAA
jgi:hypothetical protein